MDTSIFLAKLMGPILLVIGLTVLLNRPAIAAVAEEFIDNRAPLFLAGLLTLVAGLAIVNVHNVWVPDWPVIITVFGWAAIAGGIMRVGLPETTQTIGRNVLAHITVLMPIAVAITLVGGWLSWIGYAT
ncbi:MAG: hypothetical protein AAF732_06310 [Pseudomonadota bacterium]